jgi:golgi apyrase
VRNTLGPEASRTLPRVEKGTKNDEDWVIKVDPGAYPIQYLVFSHLTLWFVAGISSFAEHLDDIPAYLAPLLNHARTHIPPSLHHETPLFLLATAGMRLLSPEQQVAVLQTTCQFLKYHSNFRIDDASPAGPCGSSVRIISGEEEGLFGWLSVNYLMDGFGSSSSNRGTFGFLDMGGASTQIAFEPSAEEQEKTQNLVDIQLRMLGGEEIRHKVFVTTWLGYGTNQARERYVGQAIKQHERSRPLVEDALASTDVINDPCLPSGLALAESPVYAEPSTSHERKTHTLLGMGSLERCLEDTLPLLNKTAPCPDAPCLFNGVYVPHIDFSVSHFIGISEYWYSSEHVFGLGGAYDFVQYERAAEEFCGRPWQETLRMYEGSKSGQGATDVGPPKWGNRVDVSRLQMQCFKASWIINVLHEGLRMPRIVDPGGNDTTKADEVKDQAEEKGLWRPYFQSVDSVEDMAVSWTLGKMVLEASKEVPPLVKNTKPLPDPHDPVPGANDPPTQLIRPPFPFGLDAIDDHLSSHLLPPSLNRSSLGFPLAAALSCFLMVLFVSCIAYRLRWHIRICLRRLARFSSKRDRDLAELSMEQGGSPCDDSPTSSPYSPRMPSAPSSWWWRYLHRFTSMGRRHRPSQHANMIVRSLSRQAAPSLSRPLPLRQSTSSSVSQQFDASSTASGSSSPTLGGYDDHVFFKEASSVSLYSRSRNSSTVSLSVLVPRQTISRTSSNVPSY